MSGLLLSCLVNFFPSVNHLPAAALPGHLPPPTCHGVPHARGMHRGRARAGEADGQCQGWGRAVPGVGKGSKGLGPGPCSASVPKLPPAPFGEAGATWREQRHGHKRGKQQGCCLLPRCCSLPKTDLFSPWFHSPGVEAERGAAALLGPSVGKCWRRRGCSVPPGCLVGSTWGHQSGHPPTSPHIPGVICPCPIHPFSSQVRVAMGGSPHKAPGWLPGHPCRGGCHLPAPVSTPWNPPPQRSVWHRWVWDRVPVNTCAPQATRPEHRDITLAVTGQPHPHPFTSPVPRGAWPGSDASRQGVRHRRGSSPRPPSRRRPSEPPSRPRDAEPQVTPAAQHPPSA